MSVSAKSKDVGSKILGWLQQNTKQNKVVAKNSDASSKKDGWLKQTFSPAAAPKIAIPAKKYFCTRMHENRWFQQKCLKVPAKTMAGRRKKNLLKAMAVGSNILLPRL